MALRAGVKADSCRRMEHGVMTSRHARPHLSRRAVWSWVVDIRPLIDKRDLQDRRDFDLRYSNGIKDHLIQTSRMKVLTCPADDSASERDGALSYVVNAGYSERWRIPECHVHVLSALVRKLKFLFGIMSGDEKCGSE